MSRHSPSAPNGVTLVELVLVMALFSLVLGGLARYVAQHGRAGRGQLEATRFAEAVRASRVILGSELRSLGSNDVAATAPDSVRIRAFRGVGRVCAVNDGEVGVVYRGVRQPDPAKDSVVLITPGAEVTRAIASVTGSACAGGGVTLLLDAPPPAMPALALVFETGAYHLADGALRYRRGLSGRQPLVEALLGPATFLASPQQLRFDAQPLADSLPTVRRRAPVIATRLNGAPP